jgi:hypothetical protein
MESYVFSPPEDSFLNLQFWLTLFPFLIFGCALGASKFWAEKIEMRPLLVGASIGIILGAPLVWSGFNTLKSTFFRVDIADRYVQLKMVYPSGSTVQLSRNDVHDVYFGFPGKSESCYVRIELNDRSSFKSTTIRGDQCKNQYRAIKAELLK